MQRFKLKKKDFAVNMISQRTSAGSIHTNCRAVFSWTFTEWHFTSNLRRVLQTDTVSSLTSISHSWGVSCCHLCQNSRCLCNPEKFFFSLHQLVFGCKNGGWKQTLQQHSENVSKWPNGRKSGSKTRLVQACYFQAMFCSFKHKLLVIRQNLTR